MHYAETPQQAAARARALDSRGLREGNVRIPAGCAIAGIMDKSGARHDGRDILKAIALMHDRQQWLGRRFRRVWHLSGIRRLLCVPRAL